MKDWLIRPLAWLGSIDVATSSAYLDAVGRDLWAREVFTFIPDRDLPPPPDTITPGSGPRVAFAGFPSDFSLAFLLRLLQLDVQPVGIITSPGAHPAILGDNALSRIADHLGIPLIRAWRINDEHSRFELDELGLDAVVMASFDQIVGPRALALPRHGWLNVHPSLLPAYRGPEPVYWAIADGAAVTGISIHKAAPKVDSGPILAQAQSADPAWRHRWDPHPAAGRGRHAAAPRGDRRLARGRARDCRRHDDLVLPDLDRPPVARRSRVTPRRPSAWCERVLRTCSPGSCATAVRSTSRGSRGQRRLPGRRAGPALPRRGPGAPRDHGHVRLSPQHQ